MGAWQGDVAPGCVCPLELACRECHESRRIACGTSREDKCPPCAMVYRQRVARVAGSGLVVGRDGLFLTLTAPGRYVHYVRPGQPCRCTPDGRVDLAAWNADAAARWNRLVLELSRWLGVDVVTYDDAGRVHRTMGLTYFRAAEVQRRGALHYHVLVRRRDGGPLALSPADLRRLALKHGFGHSVDVQRLHDGHATYVAKYVSKAANDRREVPWAKRGYARPVNLAHRVDKRTGLVFDRRTGEVVGDAVEALFTVATYRTWAASRTWGLGMAAVRADQRHWVMTVSALASWRDLDGGVPAWWAGVGGTPDRPDGAPPGASLVSSGG